MQIRIVGSANMAQVESQFAAITAQVSAMNAELAKSAMIPAGGNPAGFARASRAANAATQAYNHALASSGAFRVEQLKINDAVAKNTELLQKQKLNFRETFGKKSRDMMQSVYREQLAMQQAVARVQQGTVGDGKTRMSMAVPTEVSASWDNLNNRIGMFRTRLASASSELVNWGKNTQWAGRQLMAGISMPVAAFGAAAGVMAYQVDKQLTRVAKVYDTTADQNSTNIDEMKRAELELQGVRDAGRKTAVDAAHQYGASVTETLEVQAELAATGLTGARLQESTNEVMRIATLGEIEHAAATKALISLQSVLGHTVKQTADDFNYMNSIENATSLSTDDFVEAIPRALGPMKEMGGSLQDLAVLMVAMKERGIEAGEGANAIKSMMQRLYRPSRQVREEWQQIASVDPLQFVEESGGNVMEILPKIAAATKDLDKASRVKLLAGLFGTYQVTRMSAMLKGLDDLKNGIGQTSRVMDINAQDTEEWARTAENELKAYTESAAGQFKRAWEGLRGELALVGEPFLEVASKFLEFSGAVLSMVNNMPGWAKKGLIFGAMLAALVGPTVMLIGLFANFAGNMGKFVAWSLRAVTSFEFMTKAQWAAKVSAELAERAFVKQATSAELLQNQLMGVARASALSAQMLARLTGTTLPANSAAFLSGTVAPNTQVKAPIDTRKAHGPERPSSDQMRGLYMEQMKDKSGRFRDPDNRMIVLKKEQAELKAQERVTRQIASNEDAINSKRQAGRRITQNVKENMHGGAVAGAAMAVSMATMMTTSNETANSIAKWTMIGAMVIPAMKGIAPLASRAALKISEAAKSGALLASNSSKAAVGAAASAGGFRTMAAGAKGAALGIAGMMGPIGWISTAVAGIGVGLYMWEKHQQKVLKAQVDAQRRLTRGAEDWAAAMGGVEKEYKRMNVVGVDGSEAEMTQQQKTYDYYKSGAGKDFRTEFEGLDTDEKARRAMTEYIDLQAKAGLSARAAAKNIEALYMASGDSAFYAQQQASKLRNEVGALASVDWTNAIENQGALLADSLDPDRIGNKFNDQIYKIAKESVPAIAETYSQAIASAANPQEAQAAFGALREVAIKGWNDFYSAQQEKGGIMADFMKEEGIKTGQELSQWFRKQESPMASLLDMGYDTDAALMLRDQLSMFNDLEGAVIGGVAEYNNLGSEISTVWELQTEMNTSAKLLTYSEAVDSAKHIRSELIKSKIAADALGAATPFMTQQDVENQKKSAEAQALAQLQAYAMANNIKISKNFTEQLNYLLNNTKNEASEAADESVRLASSLKTMPAAIHINIKTEQMKDILKDGMQGVQNDISTALTDDLTQRAEAAVAALDAAQQRATEGLENKHERQMKGFEARWERRRTMVEDAYDARIDKINETIKAEQDAEQIRQDIFEAEKARLDRLTESANRTIDFNMALQTGDLDEAAKIRNDMDAAAQGWALSDAADDGADQSAKRQQRLQGRADTIGDQKDAAMDALDKREEAEKESLQRRQNAEKKHLAAVQKMSMDALNSRNNAERKALDKQLELFKSFIPKNKKQLENLMKQTGLSYKAFGTGTLSPLSQEWGGFFKKSLRENVRAAGLEVAASNMWERMGADVAESMLLGMGFGSMAKFENFIKTGKLPKDFGEESKKEKNPYGGAGPAGNGHFVRHEGGWVGKGSDSRKGVARNIKGVGPGEKMVLARNDEFFVNERSAKKFGPELEAINKGIYDPSINNNGVMGGAAGMAGLAAAAASRMFAAGVARSIQRVVNKKIRGAAAAGPSGPIGTAAAGQYGNTNFTAEQLNNASVIASVGRSLGASSRDIIIALMTAMQESTLRNLDWGDRDSVGLFQQRDAWGSFAARTNPREAARMFFTGGAAGQRGLFDFPDRGKMSLAQAAQAVQVSAYPDAYAKWADEAQAIYSALGRSASSGGYVPGGGGKSRPVKGYGHGSIHDAYTGYPAVDFAAPVGTPVYAVGNGVISRYDELRGYEPRNAVQNGFRSYGKVLYLKTDSGPEVLMAHLDKTFVNPGQRVTGGSKIAAVGNTGHSTGSHLHFGATNGPLAFLKTGGMTLNDGMAMLHRGETVLTEPLTNDLRDTVRAFGKTSREIMSGRQAGDSAGQLQKAQSYARSQVGKPYIWGGVGPAGFDCSGLQSAIVNVIKGNNPNQRLFATGSMSGVIPSLGFRKGNGGSGDYSVGWRTGSPGHTSGRIGDMPIESTGNAVRSAGAAPVSAFPNQWHLPLTSVAAQTKVNPANIDTKGKDVTAPIPWTKKDGFKSSAESWAEERMKADKNVDTGFWTYAQPNINVPSHKEGAQNIAWDNTLVNLHKGEGVLTEEQNAKFRRLANNIDNVAAGAGNQYNITVEVNEPGATADEIAGVVLRTIKKAENRRPTRRRS